MGLVYLPTFGRFLWFFKSKVNIPVTCMGSIGNNEIKLYPPGN